MTQAADASSILVGLAGWDYADWAGIVYPRDAPRGFDRLRWIARFVDLIEINSTFYRPARPSVAESWVRRISDRESFRFTAKPHRSWTHEIDPDLAGAVERSLAGLEPLRAAGRLGALLVQFPQRFQWTADAAAHLERLADLCSGWPLVVEVRHRSWQAPDPERLLRDLGLGWCMIDQPQASASSLGNVERVTSPTAYLRLHGRNREQWFRPEAGRDERYDYRYSGTELAPLADSARRMATAAENVFVVQNNHFRGQALANALQLRHLFEGAKPRAPQGLVETYPELIEDVDPERTTLF